MWRILCENLIWALLHNNIVPSKLYPFMYSYVYVSKLKPVWQANVYIYGAWSVFPFCFYSGVFIHSECFLAVRVYLSELDLSQNLNSQKHASYRILHAKKNLFPLAKWAIKTLNMLSILFNNTCHLQLLKKCY